MVCSGVFDLVVNHNDPPDSFHSFKKQRSTNAILILLQAQSYLQFQVIISQSCNICLGSKIKMVQANTMTDRGTNALKTHMAGCDKMEMRQTRRGWLQECLGCEVSLILQSCTYDSIVFANLSNTHTRTHTNVLLCIPWKLTSSARVVVIVLIITVH
jgi:hypothetical protein